MTLRLRKGRRTTYSEINVEAEIKRGRAGDKQLEGLHLRVSLLKNQFNTSGYQNS